MDNQFNVDNQFNEEQNADEMIKGGSFGTRPITGVSATTQSSYWIPLQNIARPPQEGMFENAPNGTLRPCKRATGTAEALQAAGGGATTRRTMSCITPCLIMSGS